MVYFPPMFAAKGHLALPKPSQTHPISITHYQLFALGKVSPPGSPLTAMPHGPAKRLLPSLPLSSNVHPQKFLTSCSYWPCVTAPDQNMPSSFYQSPIPTNHPPTSENSRDLNHPGVTISSLAGF